MPHVDQFYFTKNLHGRNWLEFSLCIIGRDSYTHLNCLSSECVDVPSRHPREDRALFLISSHGVICDPMSALEIRQNTYHNTRVVSYGKEFESTKWMFDQSDIEIRSDLYLNWTQRRLLGGRYWNERHRWGDLPIARHLENNFETIKKEVRRMLQLS